MESFNDIINCKLILQNGNIFTLPIRKDGFIYGTSLCKAVGKLLGNWLRLKKTKELQKKLENVNDNKKVIEIYKGGNDKNIQGTWLHYELGLELAY
jgi:predicted small secreted protein